MASTVNLGKVMVTPKGVWSNSTAYSKLDIVTNQGSSYIAKKNVPSGTALTNTTYWQVMASASDASAVWGQITGTLSSQTDLQNALNGKASSSHNHDSAYASLNHNHDSAYSAIGHTHDDRYYTESETDTLLAGKASATHNHNTAYASLNHNHDGVYATASHTHDDRYYTESEIDTALGGKSDTGHNHDTAYSALNHTHDDRYYTESEVNTLLSGKADSADLGDLADHDKIDYLTEIDNIPTAFPPSAHTHDDRYYTESETDTLLAGKSDTGHNHDSAYSATGHTHDDRYYTESEVNTLLSGKSDTTHNHDSDYSATGHTHDDRYYTEYEMDTALAGKQNSLTFDTIPTTGSTNPVTSGGVYTALSAKIGDAPSDSGYYVRYNGAWVSLANLDNVGY